MTSISYVVKDLTLGGVFAICASMAEDIIGIKYGLLIIAFILSIFGSLSHWWAHNLNRDFKANQFRPTYLIGVMWIGLFGGLAVFTIMVYYEQPTLLTLFATTVSSYMSTNIIYRIEKGIQRRLDKEINKFGGGDDDQSNY